MLDPFIGNSSLKSVYMENLQPFIEKRRWDGVRTKTINLSLEVVTVRICWGTRVVGLPRTTQSLRLRT